MTVPSTVTLTVPSTVPSTVPLTVPPLLSPCPLLFSPSALPSPRSPLPPLPPPPSFLLFCRAAAKQFKGKDIEKGIAIPTSVSNGTAIGHQSPGPEDATTIAEGELVRIDLGAHIDGFIAQAGTTVVAGGAPATGAAADVVRATSEAYEAASRLVRAGGSSEAVAAAIRAVAEAYGLSVVEGVSSHEVKRFIVDGQKAIDPRPAAEAPKPAEFETEAGEVYALDVALSTGDGRPRVTDDKATTVFRRSLEGTWQLKIKASRELYGEVSRRFPTVLFATRALESPHARYALVECVNHGLLTPFPVLHEKPGALVARIKGTVLLTPTGLDRITEAPLPELEGESKIQDEELKNLLAKPVSDKKKRKKKTKKVAA